MTKRKNKECLNKEEIAEDWCFTCKDGGELLICDYGQCLKAYHPDCVGKEDSILKSDQRWICGWHSCLVCHRSSKYQCYCCENAVCSRCIRSTEFAGIKGKYGFCYDCLKYALLVEENMDVDFEGAPVDLRNRNTYEGLFREYYEIVKEKEGFDKNSILAAKDRLFKDKKLSDVRDESSEGESDELVSDYENYSDTRPHKRGYKKMKYTPQQRNVKSKKKEFVGWGSKTLIDFLQFIGQDTSEKLSQHDVTSIINKYVKEHNLYHPVKKRRIVCDARLQAVLGKKEVNRHRIYTLLEAHFAENEEESEGEDLDGDLEEKGRDMSVSFKPEKKSEKPKDFAKKSFTPVQSQFAAVIPENIKLVYLKRSLVLEIIKQPQTTENKIIGTFVRVKSDSRDYRMKNSHQLMQIAGIKQRSCDKGNNEIVLQASNMSQDIYLSMLSDDDFSPEECEDLREKVKAGLLKKLTVVELEQKARILHEDITNHWIARELSLLQRLIDRANEKGWRYELYEYLERRKQLQKPSEQSRLLQNFPSVIPDVVELEPLIKDKKDDTPDAVELEILTKDNRDDKQGHHCSRETASSKVFNVKQEDGETCSEQYCAYSPDMLKTSLLQELAKLKGAFHSEADASFIHTDDAIGNQKLGGKLGLVETLKLESVEVIDLSSSDEGKMSVADEDPDKCVWRISGQNGKNEKYSLSLLKRWIQTTSPACKFKVWKDGESEENAIWLSKAINLAFPEK